MRILRKFLDKLAPNFSKDGKLEKLSPVYDMLDTILYTPGKVTSGMTHVRDGMDLKRIMTVVIYSLIPCVLMALYNTGYQANLAITQGATPVGGWREAVLSFLGIAHNPNDILACMAYGLLFFLPVYIVTIIAGGLWEVLFAVVRKHEVYEGFFVTSLLFPLILPPDIPLWQVAVGISFGVVIGKEVFGGVGMNIVNPALTARLFLFFAYPVQISGDAVWIAADLTTTDGLSGATPLADVAASGINAVGISLKDAFIGTIPGSMGETSTLACLIGAGVLILTGIGSWRIMVSVLGGMVGMSLLLNLIGSTTNPMFGLSPVWHLVLGGFAFGMVFMATDPVSAAITKKGQIIYGALIGILAVLVRVINPGFPEGMMMAIIFANIFSPIIDHFVLRGYIKRRAIRNASG